MGEEKTLRENILEELRGADDYLSGQELSRQTGVSRTAVWKAINALLEAGYEIRAVRNKGYRLIKEPDILTRENCRNALPPDFSKGWVEAWNELDSTNNRLKQMGEDGAPEGSLVVSDVQTAGKGRRGRSWMAEAGTALTFSLLLKPDLTPDKASMLTLCAALAVQRAVSTLSSLTLTIKWPNDLVCRGRKLCGILTELSADMDRVHYVVVGIGLNVSMTEFPEELRQKACSIRSEGGKECLRAELLKAILKEFSEIYRVFLADGDLRSLKKEYEDALANLNTQVCVLEPEHEWRGICRGISEDGALLVTAEDGQEKRVISGEVSVRGIYGYV